MKTIRFLLLLMLVLAGTQAHAQKIMDGSYGTVGYVKSDGTVQDKSYRTIGYARDIPRQWAAFYFFFKL